MMTRSRQPEYPSAAGDPPRNRVPLEGSVSLERGEMEGEETVCVVPPWRGETDSRLTGPSLKGKKSFFIN